MLTVFIRCLIAVARALSTLGMVCIIAGQRRSRPMENGGCGGSTRGLENLRLSSESIYLGLWYVLEGTRANHHEIVV